MTKPKQKMGFKLEEALGVEVLHENYTATVRVPAESKVDLVEMLKEESTMSIVHERDNIYVIEHTYDQE